jgi:hypothetical protein
MNELKIGIDNDLNGVLREGTVGTEVSPEVPKIIAAVQLPWRPYSRSGQCVCDLECCDVECCDVETAECCDVECCDVECTCDPEE